MDPSRFAGLTRMMTGLSSRRLAVATAAASGLALASQAGIAAKDGVKSQSKKRKRRGKRGKQGPQGPAGATGPAAGVGAVLEKNTCTFNPTVLNATDGCQVLCPDNYVAVGGGYEGPTVLDLGRINSSFPIQSGQNPPRGWETEIEYIDVGINTFSVTTYVICLPK